MVKRISFVLIFFAFLALGCKTVKADSYSFPEYGLEEVFFLQDYVVVSHDHVQSQDKVTTKVIADAKANLDESPAVLLAFKPDYHYDIYLIPVVDHIRVDLSKCSAAELIEIRDYLKNDFKENAGVFVEPHLVSEILSPLTDVSNIYDYSGDLKNAKYYEIEYTIDGVYNLAYYDGTFLYIMHDYAHLTKPVCQMYFEQILNTVKLVGIGKENPSINVIDTIDVPDTDHNDAIENSYISAILSVYNYALILFVSCSFIVIVLFVIDLATNGQISNRDIKYRGLKKDYYKIRIAERTRKRLGWYFFSIYIRFPLITFYSIITIWNYIVQRPVVPQNVIPSLTDAGFAGLMIILYVVVLFKIRASYYALMLIPFIEAFRMAISVAVENNYGYLAILPFVLAILIWVVPHVIYYLHRKRIWLGDNRSTRNNGGLKFYDENSSIFVNNESEIGERVYYDNKYDTEEFAFTEANGNNDLDEKDSEFVLSEDSIEQIQKWKTLYDTGVITENDFNKKKAEILHLSVENNPKLVTCPDCGKSVSAKATSCPNCGRPMNKKSTRNYARIMKRISKKQIAVLAIMLTIVCLAAVLLKELNGGNKWIEKADKSVLFIGCFDRNDELLCTGSGFLLFDDKTVVTNYHVIEGVQSVEVYTSDKTKYDVKGIYKYNKESDIAILQLEQSTGLSPLIVGNSDSINKGDEVVTIGSPEGYQNSVSTGVLSGRTDIDLQFTAPISHGSSGGALFNSSGEVIGITYMMDTSGQSLNFAIPIEEVVALYNSR